MRQLKFRTYLDGIGFKFFKVGEDRIISTKNGANQFTGLSDRLGIEIYEGDIIHAFSVEKPLEVVYRNGAFGYFGVFHNSFESFAGNYNFDFSKLDIEVIGNIYENKELLDD